MAGEKKKDKTQKKESETQQVERTEADEYALNAPLKREPEKLLYSWKAPARPFKPRDKQFWSTAIALAFIFGSILYIIEGIMPVFVIIAFTFLYYVMTTVKPNDVEYKITNYGIKFADKMNEWPFLLRFWFTQRGTSHLMVVDTASFPGRIEMVIDPKDKQKIREIVQEYIPEEEASPSNMERAASWFSTKMPDTNS